MMKFRLILLFSLLLLIFSCNEGKKYSVVEPEAEEEIVESETSRDIKEAIAPTELDGIWILTKLDTTIIKNKTSAKNPTLHINISKGTILGNSGCNSYEGKIKFLNEKSLKFQPESLTDISCENSEVEMNFLESLSEENLDYIIKEEELTLYSQGTTMVFEKAK